MSLYIKSLLASNDVSLVGNSNTVTLSVNWSGSLVSTGNGSVNLVAHSAGPNMALKSLAGSGTANVTTSTNVITVDVRAWDLVLASAGAGTQNLVSDPFGPDLGIKSLANTGTLSLYPASNLVTIADNVTLTGSGTQQNIVVTGFGQDMQVKSLANLGSISLGSNATSITINNNIALSPFPLGSEWDTVIGWNAATQRFSNLGPRTSRRSSFASLRIPAGTTYASQTSAFLSWNTTEFLGSDWTLGPQGAVPNATLTCQRTGLYMVSVNFATTPPFFFGPGEIDNSTNMQLLIFLAGAFLTLPERMAANNQGRHFFTKNINAGDGLAVFCSRTTTSVYTLTAIPSACSFRVIRFPGS